MPIMPKIPVSLLSPDYVNLKRHTEARLAQLTDLDERVACAQIFYDRFPLDPLANHLLAHAIARSGREIEAMKYSRTAVLNSDYDPQYVSFLIEMYMRHAFHEQIEPYIQGAKSRGRTSAELETLQGTYYSDIGKQDDALTHYRRALSMAKTAETQSHIKFLLAENLRYASRNDEARDIFVELANHPTYRSRSLAQLAQLAKGTETEQIEKQIASELQTNTKLMPDEKERLYLALGNFHEKRKEYDAAFENWKISRSYVEQVYDFREQAAVIKDMCSFYSKELYERTLPYSNPSEKLIFVIGMARSGTTLVAQILGSHRDATSAGELARLVSEASAFMEQYFVTRGLKQFLAEAEKGELAERTHDFLKLAELIAERPAKYIVDKTPQQFLTAGYIHMCFPKTKFINLVRHPADVFISTYQNNFSTAFAYAFAQDSFAHYFLQREIIMKHWKSLFPELILDVKYEDLTRDPEPQVRRMLVFLGLDWDPACMKFFERPSMVQTFSRDQVRSAINTKSVARWKNYEKHLGPLFAALEAGGYSYPET